jgi:hypothetical protein
LKHRFRSEHSLLTIDLIANYSLNIDQSEQVTGTLSQTNILQRLHEEFSFGHLKDIADKTIKQLGMGMESPVRVRDVSFLPFHLSTRDFCILFYFVLDVAY